MVEKALDDGSGAVVVRFRLPAEVEADTAFVVGDFNDWSTSSHAMRRENGAFVADVALEPGRAYRFRYLLDGRRWENDRTADTYAPNEFGGDDSVIDLTDPAASMPASVDLVHLDGTAVLYLIGEVDMALADQLTDAIGEGMRGRRLVVDLTHATFIDSTVIGALVAAHLDAERTDTELAIVPGPENVMRTLSVSGVDVLFPLVDKTDAPSRT